MTRQKPEPKTEVAKFHRKFVSTPGLYEYSVGHQTLAALWDDCPNGLWLLGLLQVTQYAPTSTLRMFAQRCLESTLEVSADLTWPPPIRDLMTVQRAYLESQADDFDLRDAHARAQTAAHILELDGASASVVQRAFAVVNLANPQEGQAYLGVLTTALVQLGRAFSPHQVGQAPFGPRRDDFRYRDDDPVMQAHATWLKEALANPFMGDRHLTLTYTEKHRTYVKLKNRDPNLVDIDRRNGCTLVLRAPDGSAQRIPCKGYQDAVHQAYEVIVRDYSHILAQSPAQYKRRQSASQARAHPSS